MDVLNLLNSNDQDIAYYYESRLTSNAVAVEGVHYHPIEPRTVRFEIKYSF